MWYNTDTIEKEINTKENIIMSMTAFILIVGLVLLTLAAINEAIALLKCMYEQDHKYK